MDLGLAGRRAVVPAASSGLGFAVANSLAKEGASVAICGSDRGRIDDAAHQIGAVHAGVADVSIPDECEKFVVETQKALGGVDILVTNCPGPAVGNFGSTPIEAYAPALDVILMSVVRMCKVAIPMMCAQGWGRVVSVTSISARQPAPNLILSTTARAGVTGFLKTLAREVASDGVTVNSVQPGLHATQRVVDIYGEDIDQVLRNTPSGRLGRPSDFGDVVAFLCSDSAQYITGTAILIDGGEHAGLM